MADEDLVTSKKTKGLKERRAPESADYPVKRTGGRNEEEPREKKSVQVGAQRNRHPSRPGVNAFAELIERKKTGSAPR